MTEFIEFVMTILIITLSLGVGWAGGYGHGWRQGIRDAARSARFSASLRGAMDSPGAKVLADFADRQERRAARYERGEG